MEPQAKRPKTQETYSSAQNPLATTQIIPNPGNSIGPKPTGIVLNGWFDILRTATYDTASRTYHVSYPSLRSSEKFSHYFRHYSLEQFRQCLQDCGFLVRADGDSEEVHIQHTIRTFNGFWIFDHGSLRRRYATPEAIQQGIVCGDLIRVIPTAPNSLHNSEEIAIPLVESVGVTKEIKEAPKSPTLTVDRFHHILQTLGIVRNKDDIYVVKVKVLQSSPCSRTYFEHTNTTNMKTRIATYGFEIVKATTGTLYLRPCLKTPDGHWVFDSKELRYQYSKPSLIRQGLLERKIRCTIDQDPWQQSSKGAPMGQSPGSMPTSSTEVVDENEPLTMDVLYRGFASIPLKRHVDQQYKVSFRNLRSSDLSPYFSKMYYLDIAKTLRPYGFEIVHVDAVEIHFRPVVMTMGRHWLFDWKQGRDRYPNPEAIQEGLESGALAVYDHDQSQVKPRSSNADVFLTTFGSLFDDPTQCLEVFREVQKKGWTHLTRGDWNVILSERAP